MSISYQNFRDNFIDNKYTKWYFSIIEKARTENRQKLKKENINYSYYEAHHILPDCIFPEFGCLKVNAWNKILLTAKEHYMCHLLLTKMIEDPLHKIKLNLAFRRMKVNSTNQERYNSRLFEFFKNRLSISGRKCSEEFKEKRRKFMTGKVWAHKDGIHGVFESVELIPEGWVKGRIPKWTDEGRRRMGENSRKNGLSKETIEKIKQTKIKNGTYLLPRTEESRLKQSEKKKQYFKDNPVTWVKKDNSSKMIYIKELTSYLNDGWVKGRVRNW